MFAFVAVNAQALSFYAETYSGYPYAVFAQKALGGPKGEGEWSGNSSDVCILGEGGSIVLGFEGENCIYDGTGYDFIVFENAFQTLETEDPYDPTGLYFAELMYVEVSTDGQTWARFPTLTTNTEAIHASESGGVDPSQYSGFAGVHPVYANVNTNGIDPFDPAVAGGDAFDLALLADDPDVLSGTVDLNNIRYVRLIDVVGDGSALDSQGNPIYDAYAYDGDPVTINGADADALAVVNGSNGSFAAVPEPCSLALLFMAAPMGAALAARVKREHKNSHLSNKWRIIHEA